MTTTDGMQATTAGNAAEFRRAVLSNREVEVLYAWFELGAKQDVASLLVISPRTVSTHIERVRDKYTQLGRSASDKVSLLLRLLEDGYLSFDPLTCRIVRP